ncbi:Fe-S-cluster-containing hydrogenase subunit [Saprospira grandis DSM 2844]|uniref:Fe-S-cluster-containing hydrogenase subunit n=1 Tax=Saprospira grandis DSM 2844 TaxID=694433 RepID=J0P819_9BACT|nr:TAT-variant-translocated molybdopterin oxidoreductase [Saprospira grandis]EJF53677.1 Fe-S-cluster-containing hydrogenase subunit [Saprospira grandis DSM 2844]
MSKQENTNKVWVSVEDLTQDAEFIKAQQNEFPASEEQTEGEGPSRRDFLKYVGFGLGAATLASCEIPVKRAIPYLVKPEEIVPGVATYYASTFLNGGDCVPVLVKTREGRPIKIEGHPNAFTQGGTSARTQASVLDLYDTNRIKSAGKVAGDKYEEMSWTALDKEAKKALSAASKVAIVSHTVLSPSLERAIADFKATYAGAEHIQYDPFSSSALLEANKEMYGKSAIPNYRFEQAKCIVGIDCDFLGTWISPVEFSVDYAKSRKQNFPMKTFVDSKGEVADKVEKEMSVHIQFEANMSMTGSNADHRVLIKPSEQAMAVKALYNEVAALTGNSGGAASAKFSWTKANKAIKSTAKKLVAAAKTGALVVCGINDVNIQKVVNGINEMLGAYGKTIIWSGYSKQRKGNDTSIKNLVNNLGNYDAVIVMGANPAYDLPALAAQFATALKKMTAAKKFTVAFNAALDETAALCQYVAPDHHYLEAWGDVNPKQGEYYIVQPTINPLFKTRAAGQTLLTWANKAMQGEQPYFEYIKAFWTSELFAAQNRFMTKASFWTNVLHDGMLKLSNPDAAPGIKATVAAAPVEEAKDGEETTVTAVPTPSEKEETVEEEVAPVASSGALSIAQAALSSLSEKSSDALEAVFYETVALGSGQYANNPWLQEMPDPVMRTTWDNFIAIPVKWNGDNDYTTPYDNMKDGDIAEIKIGENTYQLPVIRQFGLHPQTIAIALGYGRTKAGKAGNLVGKNLFPECKNFTYSSASVSAPTKVGRDAQFACVQMHHTYGLTSKDESGKTIVDESTGKPFNVDEQVLGHRGFQGSLTNRSVFFQSSAKDLKSGLKELHAKRKNYQYLNDKGLYPDRNEVYGTGHWWAMSIDLNACTGCGACTVACMAENNVPVVGKFEVSKAHEMTWLRIDRYYYGDEETPNTAYMPMMCQHCDNAPCENVCPVAATNHSSEGLNQMTYNRCIGTRYCANNCPYKVRRFNWLDYTSADTFALNEVDMNRGMENDEYYTYMTDNLTRMVLNPDVTVRSRGVIEKCSFCVQRLQEAKLTAKVEGRRLMDGDVKVACQAACPTGAIAFGDRNDKESQVLAWMESARGYLALEEVNVRSAVTYLMKVQNTDVNFA